MMFAMAKRVDDDDLPYMPEIEAAARRRGHRFSYLLSVMVALFVAAFLLWAKFAVLDEVTRGDGKIVPSSKTQVIQNLEGGIVSQIMVREGDIVQPGDILVRIDNVSARANFRDTRSQYLALQAGTARLEAELNGTDIVFPEELKSGAPDLVNNEVALYEARKAQLGAQKQVLESQAAQRRQEINELTSRRSQTRDNLALARQEREIMEPLVRKNLAPKVDLLRIEREISDLEGELKTISYSLPRLQTAVKEAEQRVSELMLTTKAEISNELNQKRTEMSSIAELLTAGEDRVTRTEVRSPVRGTIKQIMHNTVGGVIQPGQDIMEIVPLDDTLLVEARIRPADIAFLRPGQEATIKVTAYDFSIYGGLKASLERISADTIKDENDESFYRTYLRTERNTLRYRDEELPIIPGMTTSVEILTGEKTVLDYLLKPILKARDRALKER